MTKPRDLTNRLSADVRARLAAVAVSPDLHRPGLDPHPPPEPSLHLLGAVWVASCAICGYQLITGRTQERVQRRARFRCCPVCREDDVA